MDPNLQLAFGAFEYLIDEVENLRGVYNVDECLIAIKKAREALDDAVLVPVMATIMLQLLSSKSSQNLQVTQSRDQSILDSFEVVDGDRL